MIVKEASIYIDRPVEQIFAFIIDSQNLSKWQSNLIKSEKISEGNWRVGTKFREVRRMGRSESEVQGEITALEPNKRFETKTSTQPLVTVSYSYKAENGGTRVGYKITMVTWGFMRLMEPMIADSIKSDTNADLEKLKSILES